MLHMCLVILRDFSNFPLKSSQKIKSLQWVKYTWCLGGCDLRFERFFFSKSYPEYWGKMIQKPPPLANLCAFWGWREDEQENSSGGGFPSIF